MRDTKKITQGAMLIAIAGALMMIDRMSSYLFSTFVVLAVPVVIIAYSLMYSIKDGAVFSFALLLVAIIIGLSDPILTYIVFVPVGTVAGLVYANGVKKKYNKRLLLLISIIIYVVGEALSALVITPLMGISIASQIGEIKEIVSQTLTGIEGYTAYSTIGIEQLVTISFFISIFILGVMEGLILHLLSVFILHRFKIAEISNGNAIELKPNLVLAYGSILALFGLFFISSVTNDYLKYALLSLGGIGGIILAFYGYIFVVLYFRIVLHRKLSFLLILMIFVFLPAYLLLLIVLGFLFTSGPLYEYLVKKGMKQ